MSALLSVTNLSIRIGAFMPVNDVSLQVGPGAMIGLIGTNGAGKSTLFSAITGYQTPSSGQILFDGKDISKFSIEERVRQGLCRSFQVPREFKKMTVFDNLMAAAPGQAGEALSAAIFRTAAVVREDKEIGERARAVMDFLELTKSRDELAGRLSGGQKKLLELGRLLMIEPKCLLLDEPFAGVNPVLIKTITEKIRELNRRGIAFLIIEHDLSTLSALVSEMNVMDLGCIIARGVPAAVLADVNVRRAYMGG